MPCNSISTQTLSAGLAKANHEVLAAALSAAGWTVTESGAQFVQARQGGAVATWRVGVGLEVSAAGGVADKAAIIKQAYSRQAVTWAATRAGWRVGAWAENKATITRG